MKNYYYLAAGIISLLIALLHLFGGQISLVDPLLGANLIPQVKAELLGAWHLVTIILFLFGIILFREGLNVNAKIIL